nr:hypothetical protein [Tanacetum cinerariifolium]
MDHHKRVEVKDPKIVATQERKARAAAKKREKRRQGGDGGEGSYPVTKRKKIVARKDGHVSSEATSSSEPLRTINPTDPSGDVVETAESREDRSPYASPHGSANRSVHNYSDTYVDKGGNPSASPVATRSASPTRSIQRGNVEGAQEESNALNNATALERAWFSLVRGALAQTDILERFKHLQGEFDKLVETHAKCREIVGKLVQARLDLAYGSYLYTTLSERHKAVKNEHEGCVGKLEAL